MSDPLAFVFDDDGTIPNSRLPLLVYRDAVPADAAGIERLFAANRWPPAWRDGVHPFHHFHSTAHEVLGVARGRSFGAVRRPRGNGADGTGWRCRSHPGGCRALQPRDSPAIC